jgi:glycyl-tRNA synthetase
VNGKDETRVVLKLNKRVAPYKVAVFPLLKNKPELVKKAQEVFETVKAHFTTDWDDRGNIGKRYRYQDEQGTLFTVTIDFETIEKDGSVTVRDRDTMKQERVQADALIGYLKERL